MQKVIKNKMRFGMDLGGLWERFWEDFGSKLGGQIGAKLAPKSEKLGFQGDVKKMIEKKYVWSHLGAAKAKQMFWRRVAGQTRGVGGIANLQGLARIGRNLACGLQHGLPLRGAPDPVALRTIPATVPGLLDFLVGLIG